MKPTLGEATRVWARIGLLSFGGPAGQIALMHRMLVEERRWIDETRYLHALNFCMLLPGPEAQQLATYVGWLMHGIRGGLIAGILFILPGFVVILGLSFLYVTAGTTDVVQGLFVGLKAAVLLIVVQALFRIGRRSLGSMLHAAIALGAFLAMFVWNVPFPYVIAIAAVVGITILRRTPDAGPGSRQGDALDGDARPQAAGFAYLVRCVAGFGVLWIAPTIILIATLGPENVFSSVGLFFSKMAIVTFGGAYAVLGYVSQAAVTSYHWLTPGEMIDGLALAETTPGPLIMVTQFVGFVAAWRDPAALSPGVAALLGSVLTTWVTFVPCFLWIFAGAPYMERLRQNRALSAALSAVTAAVVGVIANLALWFSIHALFGELTSLKFAGAEIGLPVLDSLQPATLLIAIAAAILVFPYRASVVTALGVCGSLGAAGALL